MKKLCLALAFILFAAAAAQAQEGLSAEEKRIVAHVDTHIDEAIRVLEEVVNINSGTLNAAGVRAVGEAFRPHFESIGFAVRWEEVPKTMRRGGHFFAERHGERGRRLLLIGHLDTVFEPDHPFQRFERRRQGKDDIAIGPGTADMKGGDVAILYALKALAATGALDDTTITVAFTGDEERVARPLDVARAGLIEAAQRSDIALGFETGSRDNDGQQYAAIARRSSSGWKLVVEGEQRHSSGIFSTRAGSGAIFEAARILNAFHEELRGERYLTFNAGVIVGGTDVELDSSTSRGTAYGKSNVIPQSAIVTGGVRTLTDEQLQSTRQRMRAIVERHLPRTKATITFRDAYPSMPPKEGNRELLALLNEINRDLGAPQMEAFDPGRRGAADISFVAPHVDAGLAALGVFGRGAHSPNEEVDLSRLPLVIRRTALLIYRLTR
jgi:glutamate carboxypeptidase